MTRILQSIPRRFAPGLDARRAVRRRAQRGVALIEALVSILIFSFGVIGLVGLEARAISFSADAEDRNRAALFANEIASSMWLAGTVTVPAATYTAWQVAVANASGTGMPNGTVAVVAVATNAATITLTWQAPSHTTTSSLTTQVTLP